MKHLRLHIGVMFIAVLVSLLTQQSFAQTGNVGIGTTTPKARLHVADSAVLFNGLATLPANPSAPPVSGAGTRMMWYPQKAAFRAGGTSLESRIIFSVNSDRTNVWDKDSIGIFSFAAGENNKAIGSHSTGTGYGTTARGFASTSMGVETFAIGSISTSMGYLTSALGNRSTSMGYFTSASGDQSTSMGDRTNANGDYSTSMGSGTNANGEKSTSMGSGTTAGGQASTSMGFSTTAIGFASTSMGFSTTAIGGSSTSLGSQTIARGVASTSMGFSTTATGAYSTSMGLGTVARAFASTSIGAYNDSISSANPISYISSDPLFIIGNGTDDASRKNALTMLKNGNTGFNITNPQAKVHIVRSTPSGGVVNSNSPLILDDNGGTNLQFLNNSAFQCGILSGTEETPIRSAIVFLPDSSIIFRSGGNNNRMSIEKNGDVGIGNTNPTERLHVTGNILASGTVTATSFPTSSDLRYKKNIKLINNPLEKINAIRGVTYDFRTNEFPENAFPEKAQVGVIAQEVEKVLPEVVLTNDKGYKAVDYSKMVPLLIEGIKEQQRQIEDLKKENLEAKKQNESLLRRLEKLEGK